MVVSHLDTVAKVHHEEKLRHVATALGVDRKHIFPSAVYLDRKQRDFSVDIGAFRVLSTAVTYATAFAQGNCPTRQQEASIAAAHSARVWAARGQFARPACIAVLAVTVGWLVLRRAGRPVAARPAAAPAAAAAAPAKPQPAVGAAAPAPSPAAPGGPASAALGASAASTMLVDSAASLPTASNPADALAAVAAAPAAPVPVKGQHVSERASAAADTGPGDSKQSAKDTQDRQQQPSAASHSPAAAQVPVADSLALPATGARAIASSGLADEQQPAGEKTLWVTGA
jgi:hypothetical protein